MSADGPAQFVRYIGSPVKQTEKQKAGAMIFVLSSIGLLSKHSCSSFDAKKLVLVKEASEEEAQIARVWGGPCLQPYGNGFLRGNVVTGEQHTLIKNGDTKQPRGGSPLGDALQVDQQVVHENLYAAHDLAEVAAERFEVTTRNRLGVLPDGGVIF